MFEVLPGHDESEPGNTRSSLGDSWERTGKLWLCVHRTLRTRLFSPVGVDNGPDPSILKHRRTTQMIFEDGSLHTANDDWTTSPAIPFAGRMWTGTAIFYPEGVPDSDGDPSPEPIVQRGGPVRPSVADRSLPYCGVDIPPQPLDAPDAVFLRDPQGYWRRLDSAGNKRKWMRTVISTVHRELVPTLTLSLLGLTV